MPQRCYRPLTHSTTRFLLQGPPDNQDPVVWWYVDPSKAIQVSIMLRCAMLRAVDVLGWALLWCIAMRPAALRYTLLCCAL